MKKFSLHEKDVIKDCEVVFLKLFDKEKWKILAKKFSNLISREEERDFIGELGRFQRSFALIKEESKHDNILSFWNRYEKHYPLMGRLSKGILVLPHTTVPVERLFSEMKDFKTPRRNRLSAENLEACLLLYQKFGESNFTCSQEMFARYIDVWKKPFQKEAEEFEQEIETNQNGKDKIPVQVSQENQNIPLVLSSTPPDLRRLPFLNDVFQVFHPTDNSQRNPLVLLLGNSLASEKIRINLASTPLRESQSSLSQKTDKMIEEKKEEEDKIEEESPDVEESEKKTVTKRKAESLGNEIEYWEIQEAEVKGPKFKNN